MPAFDGKTFEDLVFNGSGEIGIEGVSNLEVFPAAPEVAEYFLYDFSGFFQAAETIHGNGGQFIPIPEIYVAEGVIVALLQQFYQLLVGIGFFFMHSSKSIIGDKYIKLRECMQKFAFLGLNRSDLMGIVAIPFAVDINRVKAVFGCKDAELEDIFF